MRRNKDLIRCILEYIEEDDKMFHCVRFNETTLRAPSEQVKYHLRLIRDAGFIRSGGVEQGWIVVEELTWAGHEYLDSLRNETA